MPILKIVRLGHPSLRKKSTLVSKTEFKTKKFQKFLSDLKQTCLAANGAGIAAPQVGINKRVIVVHVSSKNPRYPHQKPFPPTVLVNPKIVKISKKEKDGWEGDLSFNIRAMVPRSVSCTVLALDRRGKKVKYNLSNFHARVFQHEVDHLDGVLLIDRVKRKETMTELKEWKKYWIKKKISK